ncbi:MAG: hypothetical protein ACXVJE_13460 [Mucilaginibacter sp.]
MKLLSFQPFSLYANGGGSRILRRLYLGRENQVTSLTIHSYSSKPIKGPIEEVVVIASPVTRKWMRWYLRDMIIWLREHAFRFLTIRNLQKAAAEISYDVLHVVNHGPYSTALCDDKFLSGKELWVSFHDHFLTTFSSFGDAEILWNRADRRLVISHELGNVYQKLFGNLPYAIITDGILNEELNPATTKVEEPTIIYFAGLLHLDYRELFKTLADALDLLTSKGGQFKLLLRGTQVIDFLNNRLFTVEYLPLSLDDAELHEELNSASILYLPIKFTVPDFYLYSLSTKMVGYLGAKGAILYHGPANSAACEKLKSHNAAICCSSLDRADLAEAITDLITNKRLISENAKVFARQSFDMDMIHRRFWEKIN